MIKLFASLNNFRSDCNFQCFGFSHITATLSLFSSVKCFKFDNTEESLTKGIFNDAGQCGLKSDIKDLKDLLLTVKNEISDFKDEFTYQMNSMWKYLKAGKCYLQITEKNQGK